MLPPIPKYKELSVKEVWKFVKEEPELIKYFHDIYKGQLTDRSFMWTILSTLRTEACRTLIETKRNERGEDSEEQKDELIEINPDLLNNTTQTPLISKCKYLWLSNIKL